MAKKDDEKPLKVDASREKDGMVPVETPKGDVWVPTEGSWGGLWPQDNG